MRWTLRVKCYVKKMITSEKMWTLGHNLRKFIISWKNRSPFLTRDIHLSFCISNHSINLKRYKKGEY